MSSAFRLSSLDRMPLSTASTLTSKGNENLSVEELEDMEKPGLREVY